MSKKSFVILGGNMLLQGVCDKLKTYGYHVIVVDWNENPAVKGDLHIKNDVKNVDLVMQSFIDGGYDIDGAFTSIDLAVPTVNTINRYYGLKVMPDKFNIVLSKAQMREDWMKAKIFNRISISGNAASVEEIAELNKQYDLIVKPDVAASSRGITILEKMSSVDLIKNAIKKAKEISYDSDFLVEEFVKGQEFTVDMLGDDYGNVVVYGISVKYHSNNVINNKVAVKLHWNSNVYSDELYEKIALRGKECYQALGLKNSFGHLEVIMKSDGTLTPVEIGARSSGFIASHLVELASGKDYLYDYIQMLHGENIGHSDHINGTQSSMWYGYDIPCGYTCVNDVTLIDFLDRRIKVLYSNHDGLVVGKCYEKIVDDNGRDHLGYEMIKAAKDLLTIDEIEKSEGEFLKKFCNYVKNESV